MTQRAKPLLQLPRMQLHYSTLREYLHSQGPWTLLRGPVSGGSHDVERLEVVSYDLVTELVLFVRFHHLWALVAQTFDDLVHVHHTFRPERFQGHTEADVDTCTSGTRAAMDNDGSCSLGLFVSLLDLSDEFDHTLGATRGSA